MLILQFLEVFWITMVLALSEKEVSIRTGASVAPCPAAHREFPPRLSSAFFRGDSMTNLPVQSITATTMVA